MSSRSREETDDSIKNFDFWWRPNSQTNKPAISQYLQEFYNVFLDEYGISLAELSTLVSKLEDFSEDFSDGSQLIKFKKNELITKISVLTEWSEQNIERLLDFLSLKPRQNFLEVPPGLSKTDVYPWRMSRELSYARRPIMELKTDDQIYFCWGKRHLYDAFTYIVYGSFGGWLKPYYTSESMQKWLGKKHNEDGKEFTNKVKQISENINGSIIRSEVKKFGAIRLGHPGNDLGDIDVLIVLPRIKSIILIECKNLLVARTPIEMKRELESLFIDTNKSLSTISKVVKRQKWVHDNLKIVLSSLNIDQRGKWEVNSLIVTSDELVSPYFFESSLEVISYLRYIEDYLPTIEDRILKIRN
jgi:hypothetical protein